MRKPERMPWTTLKTVRIAADIPVVQGHPAYRSAKQGDFAAAIKLVSTILTAFELDRLQQEYRANSPILVGVHAVEELSINYIPQAMTAWLASRLGWEHDRDIVQINRVGHTRASGWHRLAHQPIFDGEVQSGGEYLLLDDFVGQGGTLANLRGFIEARGGLVIGALALTGKAYSSILAITGETLAALRAKHGNLEFWWREQFGFGFDAVTESEGRYLFRAENADAIRDRLAEAKQKDISR